MRYASTAVTTLALFLAVTRTFAAPLPIPTHVEVDIEEDYPHPHPHHHHHHPHHRHHHHHHDHHEHRQDHHHHHPHHLVSLGKWIHDHMHFPHHWPFHPHAHPARPHAEPTTPLSGYRPQEQNERPKKSGSMLLFWLHSHFAPHHQSKLRTHRGKPLSDMGESSFDQQPQRVLSSAFDDKPPTAGEPLIKERGLSDVGVESTPPARLRERDIDQLG